MFFKLYFYLKILFLWKSFLSPQSYVQIMWDMNFLQWLGSSNKDFFNFQNNCLINCCRTYCVFFACVSFSIANVWIVDIISSFQSVKLHFQMKLQEAKSVLTNNTYLCVCMFSFHSVLVCTIQQIHGHTEKSTWFILHSLIFRILKLKFEQALFPDRSVANQLQCVLSFMTTVKGPVDMVWSDCQGDT